MLLYHASFWELHLAENSYQYWTYGSRDTAILVLLKTMKYKGNWLLLFAASKNNIS